jgi:PEP-CTERM motif
MGKTAMSALALAAAAFFGSANAAPISSSFYVEFESPALATNFDGGQSFTESGLKFTAQDPNGSGFVGAGSASADTCAFNICPPRSSAYYAVLNDGGLKLESLTGELFGLASFDLGFIAPAFDFSLVGLIGQVLVTGESADGSSTEAFDLQGLLDDGSSQFSHFTLADAFTERVFSSFRITACLFDTDGSCTPGASFNLGQFGIDSIQVVPEPSSYALMGLALVAAGAASRRRRSV